MDFVIEPHVAAGPIRFGMTREEVREALAPAKFEAKTSFVFKVPVDFFHSKGLKVSYGADERCEAVEFFKPARPLYDGRPLLGGTLASVKKWLLTEDAKAKLVDDGLTSLALGIGLHVPAAKKRSGGKVEGAVVFMKGYYKKYKV